MTKGESDVLIVYNITACGLNTALWAQYFWMTTVHNILDCATNVSRLSNVDTWEIYLDYPLDRDIMTFAGVYS